MLKKTLAIVTLTFLSACFDTGANSVLCDELEAPAQALSDALVSNASQTPQEVGAAGAKVVIIAQGGC